MTAPLTDPGASVPESLARRTNPKGRWWPETSTPWGAVLYAVLGGLIVWLLVDVLPHVHIHISISWH
jgi:hypothetical protein